MRKYLAALGAVALPVAMMLTASNPPAVRRLRGPVGPTHPAISAP
ncbi:hypothetical protein [Paenarthrobacter sp. NCHU4564]